MLLWAVHFAASCQAQDDPDLTAIWEIYRQRHDQVHTARLTWLYVLHKSEERVQQSIMDSEGAAAIDEEGEDLSLRKGQSTFVLAQDRVRYESQVASFEYDERETGVPHISAFDGKVQQYLTDRHGRPNKTSGGTVGNYAAFDEWQNVDLLPLGHALRPLRTEMFGPEPDRWRVEPGRVVIDGHECIAISSRPPDVPPEVRFKITAYLDPQREFVPLRLFSKVDGIPSVKIDMRYDREGPYFWVPTAWKTRWYTRKGVVLSSSEIRDVTVTINEPVPDETFTIEFPPGTIVTDKRDANQTYLVQDDGHWKTFDPMADRRALITAETERSWTPWIAGAVTCLVFAIGFLLWRRSVAC